MRKFFHGIVVTLAVFAGGVYLYLRMGFINLRADLYPSAFEERQAMSFMDASTDRYAPDQGNPIEPTELNLIEGVKLYRIYCAACHGAPDHPERKFGHPFYPPAPQFIEEAPEMPENQNFYIIQHGVRWTGMPAWKSTLSDQQIWKLVTFLRYMDKLPPAAEQVWQQPASAKLKNNSGEESKQYGQHE